jgi:hypothetical protein
MCQQSDSLVVADRLDVNPGLTRQFADREANIVEVSAHTKISLIL